MAYLQLNKTKGIETDSFPLYFYIFSVNAIYFKLYFMTIIYLFLLFVLIFLLFPYKVLHSLVRLAGSLFFNKKTIGFDIPNKGGALLISNHVSHIDFMLLALATKRKVHFVMYDTIYYHKALHWLLKRLNMIPIAPRAKKNNLDKFNERCAKVINQGGIVAIYPEGTVSRNGHILKFRKGMEHIAQKLDAPIIPIHLYGVNGSPFTYSIIENKFTPFSLFRLRKKVIINIGKPLPKTTSAFIARQKVLELEAESVYHFHTTQRQNIYQLLKTSVATSIFITKKENLTPKEIKHKVLLLALHLENKLTKNKNIILSISDEINFTLSILALNLIGKNIVIISPKESIKNALLISQKTKSDCYITDHDIFNFHSLAYISFPTSTLKTNKSSIHQRFSILKLLYFTQTEASIYFVNHKKEGLNLNKLSLATCNAFIQSISSTHKTNSYGNILNLKDINTSIGFLTKVILPISLGLKVYLNIENNEDLFIKKTNTLIGAKKEIENIYHQTKKENWSHIKTIITDKNLNKNIQLMLNQNNTNCYTAVGIEELGLLSINTPDYVGLDIAGHPLIQDGNNPKTVGRPIRGVALKIVDSNDYSITKEANQIGDILIKGALITQSTSYQSRWTNTNLKGYINTEGYLTII